MSADPSTPALLVLPLDTPAKTVAEFRAAGFMVIQTDNPDGVRFITPSANITGGDLFMAAMHGLTFTPQYGGDTADKMRSMMVQELHRRLKVNEANEAKAASGKEAA